MPTDPGHIGLFDDLVPAGASPAAAPAPAAQPGHIGLFDDLIPSATQPSPAESQGSLPNFSGGMSAANAEQPSLGLWGSIKDAFTGNSRTEFPDAPEFLPSYVQATGGKVGDPLTAINQSAVTPDPQAQLDILKKRVPGLESKTDKFGNIMLKVPGMGDWSYLNKPGLSARDIDELGTQTLATLPLGGMFGMGGSIPARIATGAVGGGVGSVVQDALAGAAGSDQGIDPTRAAISTGIGAVAGPVLGKPASAAVAPRQAALEAAARLPEVGSLPRSVATDNMATKLVAGGMQRLPIVGAPLQNAADDLTTKLGDAATRVAQDAGGGLAHSAFEGGSAAKEGITSWIKNGAKQVISQGYDALDKLIKPTTLVPLPNTTKAVNKLARLDYISATEDGQKIINLVEEAITRPQGLTYEGLKELRTRIGERVFGDIAPEQGTSARALDAIYGALSDDLKQGVRKAGIAKSGSSGRRALQAFDAANQTAANTFAVRDQLKTIVGAEADASPERVLDRIVQMAGTKGTADFGKLVQARRAIGSQWGDVASAVIARLGRDADGHFSPQRFVGPSGYASLSANGKNVLFGGNGQLRQALDDIHTVSQKIMTSPARFTNTSHTGTALTTIGGITGMLTNWQATLASAVSGYSLSWALSRPVTARAVAKWMHAYLATANGSTRGGAQVLQQVTRKLVDTFRKEGVPQEQDTTDQ